MKRKLLMFMLIFGAAGLMAQNTMQVKRIAGSEGLFPLNSLGTITFTETNMVVATPATSIPMTDIANITFVSGETNLAHKASAIKTENRVLSVTQTALQVMVSLSLAEPQMIHLTVTDIQGRLINETTNTLAPKGLATVFWNKCGKNGNHVSAGAYFISAIAGDKQLISNKLILQ